MEQKPAFKKRETDRGRHWRDYWPLGVLIVVALLMASAANWPQPSLHNWMHYYMGAFLCVFAILKLFHPSAFADGFQMYDPIAKRLRAYAYVYPYLELLLGLGYLSFQFSGFVYLATILLFGWGACVVLLALRRGLDINCPCMGTILNVPLSTVTLSEDGLMVLMAAFMLARHGLGA